MAIGEQIALLRKHEGLSLQKLADRAGISKAHIWELETGKARNPTITCLAGIARALEVTVGFLIGEDVCSISDAKDAAFFKRYLALDAFKKQQIREIAKVLAADPHTP